MSFYRLKELEKGFILDGIPLSKLGNDEIRRTQPSLNIGIPKYSAIRDPNCTNYFKYKSLPNLAKESFIKNDKGCNTIDKFIANSAAKQYLQDRKKMGSGKICNYYKTNYLIFICRIYTPIVWRPFICSNRSTKTWLPWRRRLQKKYSKSQIKKICIWLWR